MVAKMAGYWAAPTVCNSAGKWASTTAEKMAVLKAVRTDAMTVATTADLTVVP